MRGFTLLETAIVLSVLGIVLATAAQGRFLVKRAQAVRACKTIQSLEAAVASFKDQFGELPEKIEDLKTDFKVPKGTQISPIRLPLSEETAQEADRLLDDGSLSSGRLVYCNGFLVSK